MSLTGTKEQELKGVLATMLMTEPGAIRPETSLVVLNTSLGAARLRLGLKRLGLVLPASVRPATYGGLVAVLAGGTAAAAAAGPLASAAAVSVSAGGELKVGLDVEEIKALPVAKDYWEHGFYRGSFAASEIAYAVLDGEPRVHFAGFWCAKEALLKCDAAYVDVEFSRIAVAHDAAGKPYLTLAAENGFWDRLPHAVSIAHTAEVATAVVVTGSAAPEVVVEAIAPALVAEVAPEKRKSRGLAKLFGI
jgi:phosphopantetheine--protein transferase-like protein